MNEEFCATLQARLEEATGGERYPNKESGDTIPPTVYRTQLPLRVAEYAESRYVPFVIWCITGGEMSGRGLVSELEVRIDCLTWTPAGIDEGSADINRLTESVLALAHVRAFAGLRLGAIRWNIGSEMDTAETVKGRQPHPYYESHIYLTFTAPAPKARCRTI